ncbi:MAG: NUDIX domain-containing protein [Neisseria sp.]|nr:NUDIX domain-containing protein [Neisseria sp.]
MPDTLPETAKPAYVVVAGVLFDKAGQMLLASRPADKSFAGYWEFPGGKVEEGESFQAALAREFDEEIGVTVHHARPWLTLERERADARITLHILRVPADAWSGEPVPREGQTLSWQNPYAPTVAPMLPGNETIMHALNIPTALSGSLQYGLHDDHGHWHALPAARQSLAPQAAQLFDTARPPSDLTAPYWLTARNRREWLTVQDAAAVLWLGDQQELLQLLHEGVSLPVLAVNADAAQRAALFAAGVHGFVALDHPTETV